MRNYCTGCHATKLPAGQRYGAPESVQLDTFAGAKQWAIRSYVRAVHFQDMPPSGGISDIERERFKQWALCGAKGEPTDTPTVEVQDRTTSRTILSMSIEGPEDSVQLQRFIKDDSLIDPDGLLMRDEFYRVDGVRAEFVGYDEWDRDGMMISSVRFEPALPMTPEEWVEELTVTAIIEMDGSAWEETQIGRVNSSICRSGIWMCMNEIQIHFIHGGGMNKAKNGDGECHPTIFCPVRMEPPFKCCNGRPCSSLDPIRS